MIIKPKIARKIINEVIDKTIVPLRDIGELSDELKHHYSFNFLFETTKASLYSYINSHEKQENLIDFVYDTFYTILQYVNINPEKQNELQKFTDYKLFLFHFINQSSLPSNLKQLLDELNDDGSSIIDNDIFISVLHFLRINVEYLDIAIRNKNMQINNQQ